MGSGPEVFGAVPMIFGAGPKKYGGVRGIREAGPENFGEGVMKSGAGRGIFRDAPESSAAGFLPEPAALLGILGMMCGCGISGRKVDADPPRQNERNITDCQTYGLSVLGMARRIL